MIAALIDSAQFVVKGSQSEKQWKTSVLRKMFTGYQLTVSRTQANSQHDYDCNQVITLTNDVSEP